MSRLLCLNCCSWFTNRRNGQPQQWCVLCRFWSLVKRSDGCWLWTGTIKDGGYGTFNLGDSPELASRIVWMLVFGDPGDLDVLHTCDNPPCVRPDHLFLGTNSDNMKDASAKGRHQSGKGTVRNYPTVRVK